MIYQVLYNINTKTHYVELEANNYEEIRDFFYNCLVGDLIEIREIEYTKDSFVKDDLNYIHSAQIKLFSKDKMTSYSFKIPKLKKSIEESQLLNFIKQFVKVDNFIPETIKIALNFKL